MSGWKKKRYDPITKTLPTKLFNWTTRRVNGTLHDFNCGLKAYRSEVVKSIEVFGEMHRYIPFIAKKEGFRNIGEKVVKHHARKYGRTKFGFDRFINGFLDLLYHHVHLPFREEAHAFLRWPGYHDVRVRYGCGGGCWSVRSCFTCSFGMNRLMVSDQALFYVMTLVAMVIKECSCSRWASWPNW